MKRVILFIVLCVHFLLSPVWGQAGRVYDTEDGLSSSFINQILQDKRGYIWIATEYGLNKFDGVHFTNYFHDIENKYSLKNNYVRSLFEDSDGNLFVGCYNGLMRYNYDSNHLEEVPMHRNNLIQAPHITQIYQLKNGKVWVITAGQGIFVYDTKTKEAYSLDDLMEQIQVYFLNAIYEDSKGIIWLGSEYNGIIKVDPELMTIETYRYPQIPENSITCLTETIDGEILIGMQKHGVARFDSESQQFIQVSTRNSLKPFSVLTFERVDDDVWVGCNGQGVRKYNRSTKLLEEYNPNIATLNYNYGKVYSLLEDRDKNIWLGMSQKGIVLINHKEIKFDYIGNHSIHQNPIGYNSVTALCKDSRQHLWISNDNEGIYELDQNGKRVRHLLPEYEGGEISNAIRAIYEDSEGSLWIGGDTKPIGQVDKQTGQYHLVPGVNVEKVTSLSESTDRNLYLSTSGNGFYQYNLNTKQLKAFRNYKGDDPKIHETSLPNDWINFVLCDSEGYVWLGHYKGVSCYNPKTDSFINFTSESIIIPGCIGYVLMEDVAGKIWAGTNEGLFVFDKRTKEIQQFTVKDGLPNNTILALCQDENRNIWLSSYMGISCMIHDSYDFINYYVKDGLQGNEFFPGAYFKDKEGRIYFGGTNGVTSFMPNEIVDDKKSYPVIITDFSILQQPVNATTLSGGCAVVDTCVSDANLFTLSYYDNTFSLSFATMAFDNTNQIIYKYRMKGLYDTWISTAPGQNRVSYNNIPPGRYTFEVYAANRGINPPVRVIDIVITPSWYLSWWMYLIYTSLVILLIAGVVNHIRMRLRHRNELVERKHQAEIHNAKLQFFINVSHEIRTPMSLIIAPLEKLLKMNSGGEVHRSYQLIYRNAQRILGLINQLMDIHKVDKGQMNALFEEADLVAFIQEVMESFDYMAHKKSINFSFQHPGQPVMAWIDGDNFDKILLNIISNAFKYTPERGTIDIVLTTGVDSTRSDALSRFIEITITDSGIGLEKDKIERIFECFYRIDNQVTHAATGTGIGLYLSLLLVKLHHGVIKAENRPDGQSGSCFVIRLPQGCAHLDATQLQTESSLILAKAKRTDHDIIDALMNNDKAITTKAKNNINILLVEDDSDICEYLCNELSAQYKIRICNNGKEAYDSVLNNKTDLVISDVMMPDMDGIELCRKIKSNMTINHLPIVLLTAKAKAEDRIEGMESGADAYIVKPFNMEVLRSTIANLIQSRHLLKARFSGAQEQKQRVNKIELKSPDEALMERFMKIINENLSNPELNANMLASHVGLSRVHVHRKMKELTNLSTRDFIKNMRLRQAATLLREKKLGITDVAYATGFTTISYFSALFKETYGVTPKEYRQNASEID